MVCKILAHTAAVARNGRRICVLVIGVHAGVPLARFIIVYNGVVVIARLRKLYKVVNRVGIQISVQIVTSSKVILARGRLVLIEHAVAEAETPTTAASAAVIKNFLNVPNFIVDFIRFK